MTENIIRLPAGVVPFDETYILYREGDVVGAVCCVLALMPILILQSYLTWLIIDRDMEAVVVAVGQLLNEVLNQVLKRVFQHERPVLVAGLIAMGNGSSSKTLSFGMPSAHSQFMGFFTSYLVCNLWTRWGHKYGVLGRDKTVYSVLSVLLSVSVCASRWYLSYHHWDQIVIGYQVGVLAGLWYYMAVVVAVQPLLAACVSRWRWLRVLLARLHVRGC